MKIFPVLKVFISSKNLSFICYARLCAGYFYIKSSPKENFPIKLESGRHRSTKMWYCRLYHILMLQHLDAWDLPFESTLAKLILNVA